MTAPLKAGKRSSSVLAIPGFLKLAARKPTIATTRPCTSRLSSCRARRGIWAWGIRLKMLGSRFGELGAQDLSDKRRTGIHQITSHQQLEGNKEEEDKESERVGE